MMIIVLIVGSMQMAVSAEETNETPLGLEIAEKVDEVISSLQSDIKNFEIQKNVFKICIQECNRCCGCS